MNLKFKKLHTNAKLPAYATAEAAGMDVFACLDEAIILQGGEAAAIPTGIAMELPRGYEAQFRGRSGLAFKHAVFSFNGTIDSDYRGEIKGLLINHSKAPFTIEPGMRIGQLVVNAAVVRCYPEFSDELKTTVRGDKGFGSTGTHEGDDPYLTQWKKDAGYIPFGVHSHENIETGEDTLIISDSSQCDPLNRKDVTEHVNYVPYSQIMGNDPLDQDDIMEELLGVASGKKK